MDNQNEVLAALYQEYLTRSIQLQEQLVQAQLRIKELEAAQTSEAGENESDPQADS